MQTCALLCGQRRQRENRAEDATSLCYAEKAVGERRKEGTEEHVGAVMHVQYKRACDFSNKSVKLIFFSLKDKAINDN